MGFIIEFTGPLYNWLQQFTTNHWHTVIFFDWTLSTSDHTLLLHYSVVLRPAWVWVWVTLRLKVSQSVCLSWCRAPSGAHDQILVTVWQFLFCPWGRPLWREGGSVFCESLSAVISQLSVCKVIYILHVLHDMTLIYNIYNTSVSPGSVQQIMPYFW
jgi:hypothetical protein